MREVERGGCTGAEEVSGDGCFWQVSGFLERGRAEWYSVSLLVYLFIYFYLIIYVYT